MYSNSSDFSNFRVGGGAHATVLSPMVLILALLAIGLIFALPRRKLAIPLLFVCVLAPFGQQIYVGGVHLFITRILTLAGWIRIAPMMRSYAGGALANGFGVMDKLFVGWALCRASATCLEFLQVQAVVNQCGFLIDTLATYLLLRVLIRDEEDIALVVRTLSVLVCILAVSMAIESHYRFNMFGYLGGRLIPELREGRIRAQGPFLGPIPAGTFGATLICMFIWLWRSGKAKTIGMAAIVGALTMVFASSSSTPLLATAAAIVGISMWPLRRQMRAVRWSIVLFLAALQMAMKVPVWWAINHIDLVGGNSAYHRAMIVDQFIRHFSDWWLIGVKSTADWGWDMWDGANQFVAEGESGGLATFVFFVLLVSRTFGAVGTARRNMADDPQRECFFWLTGATLFSFVVSFFGISFSDQSMIGWLCFLAIAAVATVSYGTVRTVRPSETVELPEQPFVAQEEECSWFPG